MIDAVKTVRSLSGCDAVMHRIALTLLAAFAMVAFSTVIAGPVEAQDLQTFDPNEAYSEQQARQSSDAGAIDADLIAPEAVQQNAPEPVPNQAPTPVQPAPRKTAKDTVPAPQDGGFDDEFAIYSEPSAEGEAKQWVDPSSGASVSGQDGVDEAVAAKDTTYGEDDLIGAAEGVFGKGAKGLAKLIEDLLKKEGQPNAYIVGREAGGAFIVGARYGSGTLYHKVEGERKVYWTGPSVGLDAGANAANTFVLVYNLYDGEDLFKRYPAGEGQAYFVGGMHASYMRRGDVVLIPIRLGAGVRLGVNAGYMKFSKKQRWLPF